MFKSGIDPVIIGLAIGLVTSAYPPTRDRSRAATAVARPSASSRRPSSRRAPSASVASAISPNERLQYRLHPWTSFVIVPVFALANAGLADRRHAARGARSARRSRSASSPPTSSASRSASSAPRGSRAPVSAGEAGRRRWPALAGAGRVAGIGFTVSLLIASLAFTGPALAEAKLGVLAAAAVSTVVAWLAVPGGRALLPEGGACPPARPDRRADRRPGRRRRSRHRPRPRPTTAPVTIVEYANFECQYCGRAEPAIRELLAEFGDDLRYVFRHLPLADVHPQRPARRRGDRGRGGPGPLLGDARSPLRPPGRPRPRRRSQARRPSSDSIASASTTTCAGGGTPRG